MSITLRGRRVVRKSLTRGREQQRRSFVIFLVSSPFCSSSLIRFGSRLFPTRKASLFSRKVPRKAGGTGVTSFRFRRKPLISIGSPRLRRTSFKPRRFLITLSSNYLLIRLSTGSGRAREPGEKRSPPPCRVLPDSPRNCLLLDRASTSFPAFSRSNWLVLVILFFFLFCFHLLFPL